MVRKSLFIILIYAFIGISIANARGGGTGSPGLINYIKAAIKATFFSATPAPIELPYTVGEVAVSISEFLNQLSDRNKFILDDTIRYSGTVAEAVGTLENLPFMGVGSISDLFNVASMSNEEYTNFIRMIVIERAIDINPDLK